MGYGKSFQLNKVRRFIKTQGSEFSLKRAKKNDFGEPIKGEGGFDLVSITGVFHEVVSHVTQSAADSSTTRSKPQPMILCLPEEGAKAMRGDELEYKGTKYKVVEVCNPVKYDVCVDISLEVIQDG